jgi:hypothetical protein
VLGAHPAISHELLYAPAVGIAACLVGPSERDRILYAARDALMALMLAGLLAVAIRPTLVMDPSYTVGLLPGVPRFAGLTAHAVTQGSLAQVATLLLWALPYRHRWANRAAWALTLGVLLIAQSKTAWIACVIGLAAMAIVQHGGAIRRRLADPRQGLSASLTLAGLGALVLTTAVALVVGDASARVSEFLQSPEGARMATLTGRDRIWAIAAQEWHTHPVFGYGLTLWDAAYRARIDLPNATHAHNQFMDDAARAGSIGASVLVVYAAVLLVMSVAATLITAVRHRSALPAVVMAGRPDAAEAVGPEPLLVAAERGLAEVANPAREPREAIIACYAAMEEALAAAPGSAPQASDTPSEVLARAVGNRTISTGAAAALVDLFAEARFSRHTMTEGHRDDAEQALRSVLGELRSSA